MKKRAATSKSALGRALINKSDERKRTRGKGRDGASGEDGDGGCRGVDDRSVVEETSLEAFLATAELAGTEFTADRANIKILGTSENKFCGFTASQKELTASVALQEQYGDLLEIARRPAWSASDSVQALDEREKAAFVDWRRRMAKLEQVATGCSLTQSTWPLFSSQLLSAVATYPRTCRAFISGRRPTADPVRT